MNGAKEITIAFFFYNSDATLYILAPYVYNESITYTQSFSWGGGTMTENEIRLIIQRSRDEGFRALFDEYWSYAYTIVYNVLRSSASRNDIEDCTADVLSDVMLSYDTDREGSLKAYIGTSAKRRAIDLKRSVAAKNTVPLDDDNSPDIPSGENIEIQAENAGISALLLQKIEELGEPDASIIIQKYFYDRNSAETAKVLGMNPITVRSRLKRALKKLKTALTDMDITI